MCQEREEGRSEQREDEQGEEKSLQASRRHQKQSSPFITRQERGNGNLLCCVQCSCALSDPRSPSPLLAFSFSFKHLPPQLPSPSRWSDQMRRRRRKQLLSFFLSRPSSDTIFLSYSIHLVIYEVQQNSLYGEMAIEDICRLLYVLCKKTIQKSRVGNGDIWPKNGRIRSKASGEFQPITEAPVELSGMDGRFFALVLNWLPFMIVVRARKKRNGESWGRSNKQRSSSSSLSSTDRPTSFWHQVDDGGKKERRILSYPLCRLSPSSSSSFIQSPAI